MAQLAVTELADRDLEAIIAYLATEAGTAAAERYIAAFDTHFAKLADFPGLGTLRPALGDGVRIGIVSPYIVIYAFDASTNQVTVLRVVHGRRNITQKLLGD